MAPKSKNGKVKQAAIAVQVPQSREEAAAAIAKIGEAQRNLARIEADMNDEISAIRARYEEEAEPHRDIIDANTQGVGTWCEANRKNLTQDGKVKTYAFSTGEVSWRTRPPSVSIKGIEATIDALRRGDLVRFLREKIEINKEAILADPGAVSKIKSIAINQGEDFAIVPFDVELAAAAA